MDVFIATTILTKQLSIETYMIGFFKATCTTDHKGKKNDNIVSWSRNGVEMNIVSVC